MHKSMNVFVKITVGINYMLTLINQI